MSKGDVMINVTQLKGHWNEVKGKLQKKWGQLTQDDLPDFQGDLDSLVETVQRRTGVGRAEIEEFLGTVSEEIGAGGSMLEDAAQAVRTYASQAVENVQETYGQVAEQIRHGVEEAERTVQRHPTESVLMAFGGGLIAGVIVGLVLRSR